MKERLAKSVASALSFAMIGSLSKYRPIDSTTIARAMLAAAAVPVPGLTVFVFDRMVALVQRASAGCGLIGPRCRMIATDEPPVRDTRSDADWRE
jgi:hypothetical protein